MGWEIERRFLVEVNDELWPTLKGGYHLRQGYLTDTKEPSIRVRLGEPGGPVLTAKRGRGVRRSEFECTISKEVAEEIMIAASPRIVEKVRWNLGPWVLDRFMGSLEGLIILEIELGSEEEVLAEIPEGIHAVREVTEDNQYTSGSLASLSAPDQQEMVLAAYKGGLE